MAQIFFTKSKRPASVLATLGLVIVFLSFVCFLSASFVLGVFQITSQTPEELFAWRLKLIELTNLLLLVGATTTFVGILHGRMSNRVRTSWRGFVSTLLAVLLSVPLWLFRQAEQNNPNIHDITSDLDDPPYFLQLPERSYTTDSRYSIQGGRLDADYIKLHTAYFDDIETISLPFGAMSGLNKAREIAESMGWTIKAENKQQLQLEAIYQLPMLGLSTNIVIRVRSVDADKASLLDIRAVSPLGVTDYGVGARLIREFYGEIQKEVT